MGGPLDALIAEAERKAERTIALCRCAVAAALAVSFYFSVLRDRPAHDIVVSRSLLIAAATIFGYALIGLAAYVMSHPGRHRPWHAYVFVTADVGFLYLSIYLAMHNAGITPNYMTALPTVWLVPLLLAMGAMRYSTRLQAYGMVLLIAGFAYALFPFENWRETIGVAPPVAINPFFSEPPNLMRTTMLALAAVVLVVAVARTRRLLREALEESRRREQLTRFLPAEVARIVERRSAKSLREGRHQTMVVMFADIRDFTARAETMTPEAVGAFLTRFRAELSEAVAARGGVIDKFVGDGALVVFGLPEPRRSDAAAAVDCAMAILAAVARWTEELARQGEPPVAVGIGIHMGDTFIGAVGDDSRLEFTVVGDTVNVASRVEEATKLAAVPLLVTEPVFVAAGLSQEGWRLIPDVAIRGRRATVALYASGRAACAGLPRAAGL